MAKKTPLHVCLIAGEHSGDHMGALMMRALIERTGGNIKFSGIGGGEMCAQGAAHGFESLFPMEELAIAGIFEIVPHLARILRRINETASHIRALRPDVLVTIDSPAFAFRVGRKLKGAVGTHVHYVAPSVWAWRPRRARMIAGFLDHLLTIFPFEAPYFEKWGLGATFVGHPTAEMELDQGDGSAFRSAHGLAPDQPLLCVLPGSRHSEVSKLLPVFGETVAKLKSRFPDIAIVVPVVDTVANEVRARVSEWHVPVIVTEGMAAKRDAFAAADAALAASGTVTYELAMAGLPMVVAYRMASASAFIIQRMIKIKYASVVNIVLGRQVVPECIQQKCTPENLVREVGALLADPALRARQKAELGAVATAIGRGMPPASETAADAILALVAGKRENQ
ncbi:MAG: lipid-A-disaccharide synthase [Rhodospirillales bacterium]|nr:lipid-A-disaccharide synthase [Rhodospirillales bacterium]